MSRVMSDCIFCAIVAGQAPASVVYHDDHCTAFLDIQPVNPGHVLVVPNDHATYLADLPPATGGHLFQVAQQLAAALRKSGLRCEGVNLFLADGKAAFQEVFKKCSMSTCTSCPGSRAIPSETRRIGRRGRLGQN